ncbi:MAG: Uncharacterised protein [Bacteroidetes bacterium MED-G17]|nr:MAG: Uncharacterised protein [Bacteroidetes bacterium MED-G17]
MTNSSKGTPYCKPKEMAIAKQFISERKVAPSLCISTNISPKVPSLYSPVLTKMVCPSMVAFWVNPRLLLGNFLRCTTRANFFLNSVLADSSRILRAACNTISAVRFSTDRAAFCPMTSSTFSATLLSNSSSSSSSDLLLSG